MAERLGVSTSYLNLIENGQRPLTQPVLDKLAVAFDIDLDSFSDDDDLRLLDGLTEAFSDSLFDDRDLARQDLRMLVANAPAVCHAIVDLYRTYRGVRDDAQTLGQRLSEGNFLTTSAFELRTLLASIRSVAEILHDYEDLDRSKRRQFVDVLLDESKHLTAIINRMLSLVGEEESRGSAEIVAPTADVEEFIARHDNHFPGIEAAAEAARDGLGRPDGGMDAWLIDHLVSDHGIAVKVVPSEGAPGPLAQFDESDRLLILSELLPPASRRFQMAKLIGRLGCDPVFQGYLAAARSTDAAFVSLSKGLMSSYFAGALIMPYEPFRRAASEFRHDIERLQGRFDASFEQVCHRLSTLQRPGERGLPFHFLRLDIAGNLSKRYSSSGLQIAQSGGVCPRWNIHAAFTSPGTIQRQLMRMPDGTTYFCIARTVTKPGGSPTIPNSWYAVGIGCEASHARGLVYSDGLDLDTPAAQTPVGVSCRLCERMDCRQRAAAPILRRFAEHHAGLEADPGA